MSNIAWIDVETTGLDAATNHLLEIACIVTDAELNVLDEKGFQAVVYYAPQEVNKMRAEAAPVVRAMHDKTDLWGTLNRGWHIADIDARLRQYLAQFGRAKTMPVAGNSVRLDMNFIDAYLPRVSNFLDYHMRDVSTVAGLASDWYNLPWFEKKSDHTAMVDIRESIREMKHYREAVFRTSDELYVHRRGTEFHARAIIAEEALKVSETNWHEGKKLAQDFFDATEGDSGDAELSAGWALAEWVKSQ